MALQVDDGGGAALRRRIEELGVVVHTGAGTQAIGTGDDGGVRTMALLEVFRPTAGA